MPDMTPLAFAALALLAERPMHPYEMFQTMVLRKEDRNVKVRPGTLYHQVGRLTQLGYLVEQGTDREGNRPERTTYAITEQGRAVLREQLLTMLATPAEEYPEFPLAIAEAHNLPRVEVLDTLGTRIAALRERTAFLDEAYESVTSKHLPERYWLDLAYQRTVLAAELAAVEQVVDRLTTGDLDWEGADDHPDALAYHATDHHKEAEPNA
ncbi:MULTISPECIES: PadR family transcriptional regulator [unclassified Curtobacterium]|uniref:PadR family transcriptional regulator n=1 Tax=unclassified Curtobacterium TaxID=257496 RepID=UPI000DA709AD|nr:MULTISPECIES: PadR family transcriptional regulator [unclassified Curtobacterium]PZE27866.1 PadR family transcriptional regulator [Curtobacterium sp. MCBD17_028]PZF62528.1 PadR family transcriptional regulator [Curtobacterium sp. MCBD17_034]PZM39764.1 PadR family transcriptional regulator [Curtobacterium sp. MCBD17_031]WIE55207.1 PadR family transcriptional regulator [Curtobacterium sp. MCBD17_003]